MNVILSAYSSSSAIEFAELELRQRGVRRLLPTGQFVRVIRASTEYTQMSSAGIARIVDAEWTAQRLPRIGRGSRACAAWTEEVYASRCNELACSWREEFEMQQSDNHAVVKEPKTESVVGAALSKWDGFAFATRSGARHSVDRNISESICRFSLF